MLLLLRLNLGIKHHLEVRAFIKPFQAFRGGFHGREDDPAFFTGKDEFRECWESRG
jgi:hypothetical protein